MATVSALVLKHQQKKDGTFNVKIRLTHNRASRYLDTQQYVTRKQLDKDFKIKDAIVSKPINLLLEKLRDSIAKLEGRLEFFTCEDLMAHLQNEEKPIDFIAFSKKVVDDLTKDDRKSTANNFNAVANSLVDYFKRSTVLITDINSLMLKSYEKYLLTTRIIKRVHRNGKGFTITRKGLSASGLHNHMRDLRWLSIWREKHLTMKNLVRSGFHTIHLKPIKFKNRLKPGKEICQLDPSLKSGIVKHRLLMVGLSSPEICLYFHFTCVAPTL